MQKQAYNVNYMSKNKAIVKFCVIGVIVLVAMLLCFVEFTIPFTEIKYVGCFNAIKSRMGIDLNGGILAVYDVTPNNNSGDLDTAVDATIGRIQRTLSNKNYLKPKLSVKVLIPIIKFVSKSRYERYCRHHGSHWYARQY